MAASDEFSSMSGTPENGLCITCNNAGSCANRKRAGFFGVVQCEQFDGYAPPPERPRSEARRGLSDHIGFACNDYRGLCINCDFRETCVSATREGGIWHCENYQ